MSKGWTITGTIDGLQEAKAALRGFTASARRSVLRKAITKSTRPLLFAVKKYARAIRDTGALAKSIARKIVTYKRSGALVAIIGPKSGETQMLVRSRSYSRKPQKVNPVFYAHLVHGGTSPHSLAKGGKLPRASRNKRGQVRVTQMLKQETGRRHPGAKANPFIERAFNLTRGEVAEIFTATVREEIAKLNAKQLAKGA